MKIKGLNRRYDTYNDRYRIIKKIEDIRYNRSFEYYKQKFYTSNDGMISDESMRKLLTDRKTLNQVLDYFISFCPILKPQVTEGKKNKNKKDRLIKKAMDKIKWNQLNSQIYDILETEGDCFFYIYFDDDKDTDGDIIPNISLLEGRYMKNIIMNEANNTPKTYIYEEEVVKEVVNYFTGSVDPIKSGTAIYIFEKGLVTRINYTGSPRIEQGQLIDENNSVKVKQIDNRDSYKDIIPIIHISSDKRKNEKFSVIPAEDYIDVCLYLMQVQSDIRATNRQMGFPRISLVDCNYVEGDGRIGGVRIAESFKKDDDMEYRKGQVIQHASATNESMFTEEDRILDDLYNLVGVTNPTLMNRVGSSDSSKVMQQVNARMETKITRYVDSIIEGFKKYFMILFKENGVYDKKYDLNFSFEKPRSIIRNSKYDDLLLDNLELQTGQSTIKDLLIRNGKTLDQVDEHFKQINKEALNGTDDISVGEGEIKKEITMEVANANSKVEE